MIARTVLSAGIVFLAAAGVLAVEDSAVQRIRFVEDDAQNYMVSKIYELEHCKANDLAPFVTGAVKRYARNGSVDRINYAAGDRQLLTVTCPEELLPHIDDMIAKLDRSGGGITGTGIVRSVYTPQYRSGDVLAEIMTKAGISSNASEGANQDAVVAFDAAANRIFWKDSLNKDKDLKKYLAWLDRPLPQVTLTLHLYELRESDLQDIGVDYLAWKNGPGLNLFEAGMKYLESSALESAFGPYGFFLFAPSFDFSFIRILEQDGRARHANSTGLILINGHDAAISYRPTYQNLTKDDKFAAAVAASSHDRIELAVNEPFIAFDPEAGDESGLASFRYELTLKNVVERNAKGQELYEESLYSSAVSVRAGTERLLSRWTREMEVEQTIGVPFLSEIPFLKYLFGVTTVHREKVFCYLTVQAEMTGYDAELAGLAGRLTALPELLEKP